MRCFAFTIADKAVSLIVFKFNGYKTYSIHT